MCVCVCVFGEEVGEEAGTLEEKVTLQKSHLGAFHMAPDSPMTPPWWWGNLASQRSHGDPRRSTSDVDRAGLTQHSLGGLSRKSPRHRCQRCVGKTVGEGAGVSWGWGARGGGGEGRDT